MPPHNPIAYVDCETTGTGPDAEIFELHWITPTEARTIWLPVDESKAEEGAFRMNDYYLRKEECYRLYGVSLAEGAALLTKATTGHMIAGSNPAFDVDKSRAFLRRQGKVPAWAYRTLDVTDYAAGVLGLPTPWSLKSVSDALGIPEPKGKHTARGDAEWAQTVHLRASQLDSRCQVFREAIKKAWEKHPEMASSGTVLRNGVMQPFTPEMFADLVARLVSEAQAKILEKDDKSSKPQMKVVA